MDPGARNYHAGGFRVDVGWPDQKTRYVFAGITPGLLHLLNAITEPHIFLKVCLPPEQLARLVPPRWALQEPRFLMTCEGTMATKEAPLPPGYFIDIKKGSPISTATVYTASGDMAAKGRIVFANGWAVYDRIETQEAHRRKGLATVVMQALKTISSRQGYRQSMLVATVAGRELYTALGWKIYAPYATLVIPA